jgi:serine kinase of HPr protein (carbohydrate metabolism regulator)
MLNLRATCVAFDGEGVLLTGDSGSGKSDLALRAIDAGAMLVADDRVELRRQGERLTARAPDLLRGLLEVRGLGILRLPFITSAPLQLLVCLTPPVDVPRMPEDETADYLGVRLPLVRLAPFEASAPAKLRLAARIAAGHIMRAS